VGWRRSSRSSPRTRSANNAVNTEPPAARDFVLLVVTGGDPVTASVTGHRSTERQMRLNTRDAGSARGLGNTNKLKKGSRSGE
jgi:hypothetical protein